MGIAIPIASLILADKMPRSCLLHKWLRTKWWKRLDYTTAGVLLYLSSLPVILLWPLWSSVVHNGLSRAWDGSSHYAIAQIYSQTIFPDTFGWTEAYFCGMPFPNYYPPFFFWIVAFTSDLQLLSFDAAFKFFVFAPILLIPVSLYCLASRLTGRDKSTSFWTVIAGLFLLVGAAFTGTTLGAGIDYFSTFLIGLYTQPLGFLFFIAWYLVYQTQSWSRARFWLSTCLLALTLLTNFFDAITAAAFVCSTILVDALTLWQTARNRFPEALGTGPGRNERVALLCHIFSPLLGGCLAAFWIVPMMRGYDYFVTRPDTTGFFSPSLSVFRTLAICGGLLWLRRPSRRALCFVSACLVLSLVVLYATLGTPRALPIQINRFIATLDFLSTVLVGFLIRSLVRAIFPIGKIQAIWQAATPRRLRWAQMLLAAFVVVVCVVMSSEVSIKHFDRFMATSFYPRSGAAGSLMPGDAGEQLPRLFRMFQQHGDEIKIASYYANLRSILEFAATHREGRYLVAWPDNDRQGNPIYDARAINAYLGAQGNESLLVVYREDSPNSLFFYPQVNALSASSDTYGTSAALNEDLKFAAQPLSEHLARLQTLGVHYLVIYDSQMKLRLSQEPAIQDRTNCGSWSIFTLRAAPAPLAQVLAYRPALVFSNFTVKLRREGEHNFIRLAEEQYFDNWFDVRLAYAPGMKIDQLGVAELQNFGAIVIEQYDYDSFEKAYADLREFSRTRPLILLPKDEPLFQRIRANLASFPHASILDTPTYNELGEWMSTKYGPRQDLSNSAIRLEWQEIRSILEENKTQVLPADLPPPAIRSRIRPGEIDLLLAFGQQVPRAVPVLVRSTFHSGWQAGGEKLFAVTPFFTLVFPHKESRLLFRRSAVERKAVYFSVFIFLGISASAVFPRRIFSRQRTKNRRASIEGSP